MRRMMLSIKEFAAEAKLSEPHVRQLLRDGKLNGVKAGKEWRITKEEADRFLGFRSDPGTVKKELYIKDLESKLKTYEVQISTVKNLISTLEQIVGKS